MRSILDWAIKHLIHQYEALDASAKDQAVGVLKPAMKLGSMASPRRGEAR